MAEVKKLFEHEEYMDNSCKISVYQELEYSSIYLGSIIAMCHGKAIQFKAHEIEENKFELLFRVSRDNIPQNFTYFLPNIHLSDFKLKDFIILKQATKSNDKAVYKIEDTPI